MGKAEADFGKGFYMGEDYSFAEQRAKKAVEKSVRNAVNAKKRVEWMVRKEEPESRIQNQRVKAENLRGIANTSQPVVLTFEMSEEGFEAFRAVGQTDYDTSKRPRQDCKEVIQYYR
jgi:hypothetical protein